MIIFARGFKRKEIREVGPLYKNFPSLSRSSDFFVVGPDGGSYHKNDLIQNMCNSYSAKTHWLARLSENISTIFIPKLST